MKIKDEVILNKIRDICKVSKTFQQKQARPMMREYTRNVKRSESLQIKRRKDALKKVVGLK